MSNENKKMEKQQTEEVRLTYFRPLVKLALIFFLGFYLYLFVSSMILVFLTKS